jgi:hypothetical protein
LKFRRPAFLMRCLALVLVVLALCSPYLKRRTDALHIIHLVDVSESVDLNSSIDALKNIRHMEDRLRSSDTSETFVFADGIRPAQSD